MAQIRYVVALQCHIVKERCSGFLCENAFWTRTGGFAGYPADQPVRYLSLTCGGCCGRATLRKLTNLLEKLGRNTDITPDQVMVHFASCVCKENYHGPRCPHYDYLKQLTERAGLQSYEGTRISAKAESRRNAEGRWNRDAKA